MSKQKANPRGGKSTPGFSAMPDSHREYSSHHKPRKNNDVGKVVTVIALVGLLFALYFMFFGPKPSTMQGKESSTPSAGSVAPQPAVSKQSPTGFMASRNIDVEIKFPEPVVVGDNTGTVVFRTELPLNGKINLTSPSEIIKVKSPIKISGIQSDIPFKFSVNSTTSSTKEKLTIIADILDDKNKKLVTIESGEMSVPVMQVSGTGEREQGLAENKKKTAGAGQSQDIKWTIPMLVASLLFSIVSLSLALFSYLDKSKYANLAKKYELDRVDRYVTDEIGELKKRIQSITPPTIDPVPESNDIQMIKKSLLQSIDILKSEMLGEIISSHRQLDTRISTLSSKVVELSTDKPEPRSEPIELPDTSRDKAILTDDEQQILGYLLVELNQPEVYYGRVCLCTKGWNTFGKPLKDEIRKSLNINGVEIIEPVRGEPVNRTTMSFDFLPESYRMVVNDTVMLGLRVHDTGDVFKAKVIVE
jgi:hypothetical protein